MDKEEYVMGFIVFLGDSITDAERKNSPNQLGYGYVNILAESLKDSDGEWNIVNRGVNGYITEQVARGLQCDCISLHPDYVSILVGINDIGMIVQAQASWQDKLYLLEDSIRSYHEMLFDLSRETAAKVVILEPFIFPKDEKYQDWVPWQKKMAKNIRKLAKNYGAYFISTQEPLNQEIERLVFDAVTTDGIHLTSLGHQFLADIIKKSFRI